MQTDDAIVDAVHVEVESEQPSNETKERQVKPPEEEAPQPRVSVSSRRTSSAVRPSLKILVASWNVGNAMPPKNPALISRWIPEGGGNMDVIAIGLQESSYREKTGSVSDCSPERKNTASSAKSEGSESENIDGSDEEFEEVEEVDLENPHAASPVSGNSTAAKRVQSLHNDQALPTDPDTSSVIEESALDSKTASEMEVIVKRSRAKKSMRKVSSMVKQLSTNLRDTVGEALEYPFIRQLMMHVGENYELVGKVELMEMRLFVIVHIRNSVSDVDKLAIPTGLGSVIGNKGGLLLKCVVENTSLCFASCHLAAHQDQKFLDKRNNDCATILGTNFGRKNVSFDFQFDHCFWFGDLNYRIDMNYSTVRDRSHEQHFAEVQTLVRARKWTILNRNDQLKHQIELKKALACWELPPAQFAPTFKRVRYVENEYNSQRVPSYCDRVLHKSLPGLRSNLKLNSFSSVEAIGTSDHKPVAAEFTLIPTPPIRVDQCLANATATSIELTELVAKDLLGMDLTGLSDPYIKFYSVPDNALQCEATGSHPSTAKIPNTLSPAWRDDQIPKLHVLCDTEKDVKHVHIILLLMDYDATSKDDVLGVAILSLDKFCLAKPRFLPFDAPVTRHGKAAGSISGKMRVTMPHQLEQAIDTGVEQKITIARCHCSIS